MRQDMEVTQLLRRWAGGSDAARDDLMPVVYAELQAIARRLFASERQDHTLQPTALVHEAYVRLIGAEVDWQDRAHFYALSARVMRRLLIDHADARRAAKRGGGAMKVTLGAAEGSMPADAALADLADALRALAALDERKAQLIDMQYFAGLTTEEMATVTGLSVSTVGRELRFARAWLKDQLAR